MAHYAVVDENNIVVDVFVGRDEDEVVDGIQDWETYYSDFVGKKVLRTSYNTFRNVNLAGGVPFRKNYAQIGGTYDSQLDAFVPVKNFPSWVFNPDVADWDPPVPKPDDGNIYFWDESFGGWVDIDSIAYEVE